MESNQAPSTPAMVENGMRRAESAPDAVAIKEAALDAASSVGDLYHVSQEFLERQTQQRPYAVLGAAAGIGFVLGGGLASRFGGILLSIGGRVLASRITDNSTSDYDRDE